MRSSQPKTSGVKTPAGLSSAGVFARKISKENLQTKSRKRKSKEKVEAKSRKRKSGIEAHHRIFDDSRELGLMRG
jgi:hypothetical protein